MSSGAGRFVDGWSFLSRAGAEGALMDRVEGSFRLVEANYHGPKEVRPGAWLYTCQYEARLWPIGYCSPDCLHPTSHDAERHYREFLLDSAQLEGRWEGKLMVCEVCGTWTDRYAVLKSYVAYPLCSAHLNRDGLAQLSLVEQPVRGNSPGERDGPR